MPESKPASQTIIDQQKKVRKSLPFHDRADYVNAKKGFLGRLQPNVVTNEDGATIWNNDSYEFLNAECPDTANPSLWRQSQLARMDGLYRVVDGIYQVRGEDLSNTTFIEGDTGLIVIDPLTSAEAGAAALGLYREHRGATRQIKAIIYTHSHVDHFGGVKGMVSEADVQRHGIQILAPEGFLEHAVSENVFAGTAMSRRAGYMYGAALPRGPRGQIGAGLGQTTATGTVTLIAPTVTITCTGERRTIDGVEMVFQMAPDTEAPAEMLIFFPRFRALCAAEVATHTFHNILTLRGALVRDPHGWARHLNEAIDLWGGEAEVVFASHHWPTWGAEGPQRQGRVPGKLVAAGRAALEAGDLRWAAEVLNHAVFAAPGGDGAEGRAVLADTYEQLGYGAENGPWRNFYMSGAAELRAGGSLGTPLASGSGDMLAQMTPEMLFDTLAVRVDGPKAWEEKVCIKVVLTDAAVTYHLWLSNGALIYTSAEKLIKADVTITGTSRALSAIVIHGLDPAKLEEKGLKITGDGGALSRFGALLDSGDASFNIVTP
ncbi:Beta-lactamase-like protein [Cordyceps fumosorosea ARSEF 2679]|uniref:Beta-lactamase-like protein n=1 Tax=Cordyceps fumosorosea (strain ARSEF 2679) TaxID=1081104 RepID=A0A168E8B7_CORFA|nr:Beta-lactamase-like protein [Cordyceps fumosorosea ARSEF 2679]OAA73495.1 Beta-lactamase-like protein [Cordyceps fumosorosea ARSEF 2679]